MSHQVTVDFEGVSNNIQIQCQTAASSLCKIDKVIEQIKKGASKIINKDIRNYEEYLVDSKNKIQNQIDILTNKLEEYKALKIQRVDSDIRYASGQANVSMVNKWNELNSVIKAEGDKLINMVGELTGAKLAVIEQMVNEGLLSSIDEAQQRINNKINGVKDFDVEILERINNIDDVSLRDLAYREMDKGLNSFDEILSNAQKQYDVLLGKTSFVEDVKKELSKSGLSTEEVNEITSKPITAEGINQMSIEATNAIAAEKIRKETLKVIIKSIRDRGFIVDTKNNLKIDRKKNIVKLVAKKADGKTAEFEISLNGKFMYHFEGYEGQACQKDITPFIEDLKNIYDINILHEEVQWSNPDKIQTQKYQYMNTNKGKN